MKVKYFDYHIQALDHGDGKPLLIQETVEAAIKKGLSAICLTDHFPLPGDFKDLTDDKRVSYPAYAENVKETKEKYKDQIEVRLGAEVDYLPQYLSWIKQEINLYRFDYLIGSVHYLRCGEKVYPLDYTKTYYLKAIKESGGVRNFVTKYYQQIQALAQTNLFDCVGHLDRIKEFNYALFSEKEDWYRKLIDETLDIILTERIVMEVNTSGWNRSFNMQYPSTWILDEAYKRGIELTVGSDAHVPNRVGKNIERGVNLIKKIGYKRLIRFQEREKKEVEI